MTPGGPRAGGPLVVPLDAATREPLSNLGGKAMNLVRLAGAGLPVPKGFCLTADAYRMAVPPSLDSVAGQLDDLPTGATPEREELARQARAIVASASVPQEVDAAVRAAYAEMAPGESVAVRSSATAEDLPFASFAGQQDSFMGIRGADAVVGAVHDCWLSLWNDRAVAYRSANRVGNRGASMAVVVQVFVDSEVAGVMFTANPVSGTRTQTVIDAAAGPGQAVVSGALNPHHIVVDTVSGDVVDEPSRTPPAGVDPSPRSLLTKQRIRDLAALGHNAQLLMGAPQDIEWVIDVSRRLWVTQSRPITTLYPLPEDDDAPDAPSLPETERVYLCATLLQGLTRPLTPMGLALLGRMRSRGPWRFANPGLRMYVDITPMLGTRLGRAMSLRILPLADGRSAELLPELLRDPRFAVRRRWRTPRFERAHNRTRGEGRRTRRDDGAETTGTPMLRSLPAMVQALVWPEAALRRADAYGRRAAEGNGIPGNHGARARLAALEREFDFKFEPLIQATLPAPAVGYIMLAVARRLLRGIAPPRELEAVLRGLPHNVTTEMDLELWRLAADIGKDPSAHRIFAGNSPAALAELLAAGQLPARAQSGLRDFLHRYGHRAVAEIDVGMPRWAERPEHLLGMVSNYLALADPRQAPDVLFQRAADRAEEKIRELVAAAAARGPLRGRLVALSLRRVRQLAGLRELPKFHVVRILGRIHRQLLLVGADLVGSGAIGEDDDVFFLRPDELAVGLRGADLTGLVGARRRLYESELHRRHIPRLLLSDGTDVEAAHLARRAAAGRGTPERGLLGTPASAGTATGRVRVVRDPIGARIEPGEILVAPSTDPGWTPLFMTAGAVVMEMGGVISHGAVVAREYGIPAVVGVPDATTRLRTGQVVTVDGAAGTVSEATDEAG